MNLKIEPVTPFQRAYDKSRKLKTGLLAYANRANKPKPIPILGIIKGRVGR